MNKLNARHQPTLRSGILDINMKGVKGMTLKEAIVNYFYYGINIKRGKTGKLIHTMDETITVRDAIADDWIPNAKVVKPNDVILRKVRVIAECGYDIKYANIHNEKAHKEGWLILEDGKITGMLSNTEMAAKVDNSACVEIQGKEVEYIEALINLIKILFSD